MFSGPLKVEHNPFQEAVWLSMCSTFELNGMSRTMLCSAALMVRLSNFYSSFKPNFSRIFCSSFKLFGNQTVRLSRVHCTSNEKLLPWAVEFYLSIAYCSDLSVLYEFVIWHMKHSTDSTSFRLKLFCLTLKNNTQQLFSDVCCAFLIMLYNSLQNSWSLCHGSWSAHNFVGV
jgi:hypothetical protein